MNSFNLNAENTIEVEMNEAIYLVDKSSTDAVSGVYLIDVDGLLSFNRIQRFPGKKLARELGMGNKEEKISICKSCKEEVKENAKKCPHCEENIQHSVMLKAALAHLLSSFYFQSS